MPYIARTEEEIFSELQAWSESPESKIEGTFTNDVLATNSIEFYKLELELEELYRQAYGDTAKDEYLVMRAKEHGVIRREATKAQCELTVTGKGTVVAGAIFATEAGIRFSATETKEIDGTDTVSVEAVIAGSGGNVAADTIKRMPLNIRGINSVTNLEPAIDGYDREDDEILRDRYLLKVRRPGTTGNPADYIHFCLSIEGVGGATILRNPYGRGTVGICIVDSNLNPASEELIERVSEYISTVRPIGAQIFIDSATPITIDISADIVGNLNIETFKTSVNEYFRKLILAYEPDYRDISKYEDALDITAAVVTRGKIGKLFIESGATEYDYDSIRLCGNFNDIPLKATQMPLLGTVAFRQTIIA